MSSAALNALTDRLYKRFDQVDYYSQRNVSETLILASNSSTIVNRNGSYIFPSMNWDDYYLFDGKKNDENKLEKKKN
jgi:hypothetical protein